MNCLKPRNKTAIPFFRSLWSYEPCGKNKARARFQVSQLGSTLLMTARVAIVDQLSVSPRNAEKRFQDSLSASSL